MQNPVGYTYNPATGRAEMNDFAAVLFNKVQLVTFPHVVLSAYLTGAAFVVAVSFWQLTRGRRPEDRSLYRLALRSGAVVALVSALGVAVSGDFQGKVMTEVQPMKMAAAEALYDGEDSAGFSLLTIGSLDGSEEKFAIKVPGLLSFLATGSTTGDVEGINELREQYQQTYGQDPGAAYYSPGDYTPTDRRHLLDLPADDRPGPGGRAAGADGSCGPPGANGCRADEQSWPRPWPFRCCPCWPTRSAGSSPRSAVSRGPSSDS